MPDVTDIAAEILTTLAALPDVDYSSMDDFEPAIKSQKVALLIVPFEQRGVVMYAGVGTSKYVHEHRIVCEFWIKVDTGNIPAAMRRGRDICLQAIRLLAQNVTLGGNVTRLGSNQLGTNVTLGEYEVLPQGRERNNIPYIIARLFVPVTTHEIAAW